MVHGGIFPSPRKDIFGTLQDGVPFFVITPTLLFRESVRPSESFVRLLSCVFAQEKSHLGP